MFAVAGYDYVNLTGTTLYFGSDDYLRCFNITTLDDNLLEGNETFQLSLTVTADVEYTFVGPSEVTLHIIDNDGTCVCVCACACVRVRARGCVGGGGVGVCE